jgi:hypothetical protein
MRLFPFDDPVHSEVVELLPWFANGTLDSAERAGVERHLTECIACRHELESLRTLRAVYMDNDSDPVVTQALARLQARIDQMQAGPSATGLLRALAAQWRQMRPWLRGAFIAQFVVLTLVASAMLILPTPRYYHTLGAPVRPANERASVVVVFDATRPEREIRDLLLRLHARITDGPSPDGAYTLEIAAAEQQRLVAQLQQEGLVTVIAPKSRRPSDPQ